MIVVNSVFLLLILIEFFLRPVEISMITIVGEIYVFVFFSFGEDFYYLFSL